MASALRSAVQRIVKGAAPLDPAFLSVLACPFSKSPLRYDAETNELVSDAVGVAFPVVDGIPCLHPSRGRIVDEATAAAFMQGGSPPSTTHTADAEFTPKPHRD
jgi:uncharacterized protein YbaR (Trm112 family)